MEEEGKTKGRIRELERIYLPRLEIPKSQRKNK
jgi:hypothetical protein